MAVDGAGYGATISYTGRFRPHPGLLSSLLQAVLVPPIFRGEVRRSVREVKRMAESRSRRPAAPVVLPRGAGARYAANVTAVREGRSALVWAGYAACAWGLVFAGISFYWGLG